MPHPRKHVCPVISATADPETGTKEMLTTIEAEDIETPPRKAVATERKIGFGA